METEVVHLEQKAYVKAIVFGEYNAGKTSLIAQLAMGKQIRRGWLTNFINSDLIPKGAPDDELRAFALHHFVQHHNDARRLPTEIESPSHRWIVSDTRGHRTHFGYFITTICGSSLGILVVTPEGVKVNIIFIVEDF